MLRYVILLVFVMAMVNTRATHLAGGQLEYECIAPNTYLVSLTIYRDCNGSDILPGSPGPELFLESQSCGYPCASLGDMAYVSEEEIDYGCGLNCSGGAYPGFERFVFQSTVELPFECPDWKFNVSITARNSTTYANSGNYVNYCMLNNTGGICNNSPSFSSLGVWLGCVNTATTFDNVYTEPDGDVLVFEITDPLSIVPGGTNICNSQGPLGYLGGLSAVNPVPTLAGMSINPSTGQLSMTPTGGAGTSYFAIKIKEYRGGVLIGEIIRDGEIIIDNCTPTTDITFGTWMDSGEDSLWVIPESEECFDIPISSTTTITDVFVTNYPESLFVYEVFGIGSTNATIRWCPNWDAFDDFCEALEFFPRIVVSNDLDGCFVNGGAVTKQYKFATYEEVYCPEYRFFTNRGPSYPKLPLPSVAKAQQAIYIGDEMPVFSGVDPADMGGVEGSGDHWFEAPEIIISCSGGGLECVNFTASPSGSVIVFKEGDPLCGPDCPPIPLEIKVSEMFECGNERIEVEILGGEPPFSTVWYDYEGNILSTDTVVTVHAMVSDSSWFQEVPYSLVVEDISGATTVYEDVLHGTERFYRDIRDNMFLFTHPDWPDYPDSTSLYDANLWCQPNAPFFIFDGINDGPPWYGATEVNLKIFDGFGGIQYELNKSIENTDDWSFDNKEWSWDGTIGNSGNEDDCLDGTIEVFGDYRLVATNCFPYVHEEIDIVGLIACYFGDWSDSIIVAKSNPLEEGVLYNGIHFVRRTQIELEEVTNIKQSVNMFPNPADNVLNVYGVDVEVQRILVFDLQGKLLRTVNKSLTVDISDLPPGAYSVRIQTSQGSYDKMLIVN